MGIQINGQTDTISAIDGALTVSGADLPTVTNLNASGIVTATGFVGNITGNVNATGVSTIATLNVTQSNPTNLNVSGVTTTATLRATSIVGVTTAGITTAYIGSVNDGPISGARNRIINGDMSVWQRGTTQTTSGYGSADRWNMTVSGTCTFAQETSVIPSGAQYAVKWTTGASSSYGQVRQYIEQLTVIPLRGQTLTASAYVRSGGTFSGNVLFEIGYNTSTDTFNSGVGWTLVTTTTSGTVNSSNYTQIKTTFTIPSNAVGLYVAIVPDAVQASGAIVYQSLVQLEPGTVATPFERRSYGQELALCQRYYYRINATSVYTVYGTGWNRSTSAGRSVTQHPVIMRTAPTSVDYNLLSSGVNGVSEALITSASIETAHNSPFSTTLEIGSSGAFTTGFFNLTAKASTASYLGFSAEL